MKHGSSGKFQVVNAMIWAVMIVACTFVAEVLKEPEMIMFILIAGWVATAGLLRPDCEAEEG